MSAAPPDERRARAARLTGLYAVTPDERDTTLLCMKVGAALAGGAAAVQYRNKSAEPALRAAQAHAVAEICRAHDALFIVNDDAKLAHASGADGVHVGEDDGAVADARSVLGDGRLVGVSCYGDFERARRACSEGADYIAFGSFFASSTKPGARHADLALLARSRTLGVPVVAIGGITAANAGSLVAAGADAVAVIADVFTHDDAAAVERAAAAIVKRFAVRAQHTRT
ncbi:MAG: thiamine phosphate synthase [Casimicrobiaceae bacterium]